MIVLVDGGDGGDGGDDDSIKLKSLGTGVV
jgi:hypothetical protein